MIEMMTIGQLAAAAGVNVETVRYYQRRELLATPSRPSGSIGRYSPSALTRLRFIKRAQSLGFTLDDVQALLSLDDGRGCSAARVIGERKLADVRERLQALRSLEIALADLVSRCSTKKRKVNCPLIEALMLSAPANASPRCTGASSRSCATATQRPARPKASATSVGQPAQRSLPRAPRACPAHCAQEHPHQSSPRQGSTRSPSVANTTAPL